MNRVWFVLCFALLSTALDQEFASDCPEPNGYFADAYQCDKYYACVDSVLTERVCPDGMVFSDLNPLSEVCDFPFHVNCSGRPELQPANPSSNCPRQNGYFPHGNSSICNQFFFCAAGTGSKIICPESLVFSLKTGTCVWPDQAGRTDCSATEVLNFTCPKVSFEIAVAHPRYPDPVDCQYFYVCINGETPRRNGCKFGEVFNSESKACDEPRKVPECKDYYKEYFEQFFANDGTGSKSANIDILAAAIASGFQIPDRPQRVKINPGSPPRRRKPIDTAPAAADPQTVTEAPLQTEPAPIRKAPPQRFPSRSEAPAQSLPSRSEAQTEGLPARPQTSNDGPTRRRPLRRRPLRRQETTTTTTTTEQPPADYEYYYYDEPAADTTKSTTG